MSEPGRRASAPRRFAAARSVLTGPEGGEARAPQHLGLRAAAPRPLEQLAIDPEAFPHLVHAHQIRRQQRPDALAVAGRQAGHAAAPEREAARLDVGRPSLAHVEAELDDAHLGRERARGMALQERGRRRARLLVGAHPVEVVHEVGVDVVGARRARVRRAPRAQDLDGVGEAGDGRQPVGDGVVVALGERGGRDAQGLRQPPLRVARGLVGRRRAELALRLPQHLHGAHRLVRRLEGRRQLQPRAIGERAAALDVGDAAGETLGAVGPVGLPVRRRRVEQQVVVGAPGSGPRGAAQARDRGVGVARRDERRPRAAPGERRERALARGHLVPHRRALGVASGLVEQRRAQELRLERRVGAAAGRAVQLGERVRRAPGAGELHRGGVRRSGQPCGVRRRAGAGRRGPRGRRGQHAGKPRAGAAAMGEERTHRDRAYASAALRATGRARQRASSSRSAIQRAMPSCTRVWTSAWLMPSLRSTLKE